MANKLTNRLRGQYEVGEKNEFGSRSFADFIPPISLEAADRIEALEQMLRKKLDLVKCGIAVNYSGNPYENKLYTEAADLVKAI